MSEKYPLKKIKEDLEELVTFDKMDMEERRTRIAALHALAEIRLLEEISADLREIRISGLHMTS